MGIKGTLAKIAERLPVGTQVVQAVRRRRIQRDWSTVHTAKATKTSLAVHTTIGLGDIAVARQICETFENIIQHDGDPELGSIVLTAGAWPPLFRAQKGDHTAYWWWSQNGQQDWLAYYLEQVRVKPDVVACLSKWCLNQAE